MKNRYDFWTNEPTPPLIRIWDHAWPWLMYAAAVALIIAGFAQVASADDLQCEDPAGCWAYQSTPTGTRKVHFRQGGIVSTSGGWFVMPDAGWRQVDFEARAFAGLLP